MSDPMTPATLLRVLKAEGCTLKVPYADWGTYGRDEATGKTFGPVHGVMIHHTAGHDVQDYLRNGTADLPGPLCHAYITQTGDVVMMSAHRANHAGGGDPDVLNAVIAESYMTRPPAPQYHEGSPGAADGNDTFYGFECENLGDGSDVWEKPQYEAMVRASAAICRYYQWTERSIIGHLEWSNWKIDPKGFPMPNFRADVKACLALAPGLWRNVTPAPVKLTVEQRLTRIEKRLGL